jgi:hypothetical protein
MLVLEVTLRIVPLREKSPFIMLKTLISSAISLITLLKVPET